jgi:hypothetical protein
VFDYSAATSSLKVAVVVVRTGRAGIINKNEDNDADLFWNPCP